MKTLITAALFIGSQLLIFTSTAQPNPKTVTLYSDDFTGMELKVGIGNYDYMDLIKSGISVLRSLKVPEGMKVTLYEKNDFQGNKLEITQNANYAYLKSKGFGQVIQNVSLIVEEVTADPDIPFVTIYKDNFSGPVKKLTEGHYEFNELGNVGNDQLSAVKIPTDMKVTLYEHSKSGGRSLVLTGDTNADFLVKNKFNDITSSIDVAVIPAPVIVAVPEPTKEVILNPKQTPTKARPSKETYTKPIRHESQITDNSDPKLRVTVFQDNFSGPSKQFPAGRYDLSELGISDNSLSSVKVPEGVRLKLYELPGFKGKSITIEEEENSQEYFDTYGFNNITSSLIVELIPRATIFEGNYDGRSNSFKPGFYDLSDLNIENDELSSVILLPGIWVLLFQHNNFSGRSLLLTQTASNDFLKGKEFDNSTSSMIVGRTEDALPEVTLYQGNFEGRLIKLTPGEYPLISVVNNQVASIELPRGFRVTLFENPSFEGGSISTTQSLDQKFLQDNNFINIISSVIIETIHPRELYVSIHTDSRDGFSQKLGPGKYVAKELGIGEDELSFIKVPRGMKATLFKDDNFRGARVETTQTTDYSNSSFDNSVSSIIIEDTFNAIVNKVNIAPQTPVVDPTPTPNEVVIETTVNEVPTCSMSDQEYYTVLKAIESKPFSDDKMSTARLATKEKCLTNNQIRGIARLFSFEEQTLEFVKDAYGLATEKSTYYTLDDVFKFMSTKDAFKKFLNTK